jgi:methyl-accepting chemotaxis protein
MRDSFTRGLRGLAASLQRLAAGRAAASQVSMLPVLCSQLEDTARHVEDSVVNVCGHFQQIAERAQRSVSVLPQGDGGDVRAVGEVATAKLHLLLDRIARSSELSMRAVAGMERVEENMRRVNRILGDIDRLAMSTHLLALNAAIEAARSGHHGQAFGVIADEMAHMASDSGQTSVSVREIVATLTTEVAALAAEMRTMASANLQETTESRADIEGVLAALTCSNEELRRSVVASAEASEALARDISAAIVTLQFQDAVTQRVGHVVDALDTIHRALAGSAGTARPHEVHAHISRKYTMQSERDIHAAHLGESQPPPTRAGGTVELF